MRVAEVKQGSTGKGDLRSHKGGRQTKSIAERQRRIDGGLWLKECREKACLTQRELADKVGLDYYTFISQIETGVAKPPETLYELFAETLQVNKEEFAKRMLRYYSPHVYKMIWGLPL